MNHKTHINIGIEFNKSLKYKTVIISLNQVTNHLYYDTLTVLRNEHPVNVFNNNSLQRKIRR